MSDTGTLIMATMLAAAIPSFPAVIAAISSRRIHHRQDDTIALMEKIAEFEIYTHMRNHDIMNGQYRIMLSTAEILRRMGIPDFPNPEPPKPVDPTIMDAFRRFRSADSATAGYRRMTDPPSVSEDLTGQ